MISVNKKTKSLTITEYTNIIETMIEGFCGCRPNKRAAIILMIIADTGEKLSEVLNLRYNDLSIKNQLSNETKILLDEYICNFDETNELIFSITERAVQKQLKIVCDYLNYDSIGIHSFKEFNRLTDNVFNVIGLPKGNSSYCNTNVSGIYSIRCKKNGRIYIGESENIEIRWCQHKTNLRYHTHHSKLLQEDYDKYGLDAFVWSVLCECKNIKERKSIEKNYINALGTIRYGYNSVA